MMETILKANQKKKRNKYIDYYKSVESFNVDKKREHKERIKFNKEKEYAL